MKLRYNSIFIDYSVLFFTFLMYFTNVTSGEKVLSLNKSQCSSRFYNKTCCNEGEFSCNNGECIKYDKVCNAPSHIESVNRKLFCDCTDCYDEVGCFVPTADSSCDSRNHKCHQECLNLPDGKSKCICYDGYILDYTNRTCSDFNNCESEKIFCVPKCIGTSDSTECICKKGFHNDPIVPKQCKVDDSRALIIFSNGTFINAYNISSGLVVSLVETQGVDELFYDPLTTEIYWWNQKLNFMTRSSYIFNENSLRDTEEFYDLTMNNSSELNLKYSFSFDWTVGNLYWINRKNSHRLKQIRLSQVNSEWEKTIVGHLEEANSLVLDPERSTMYWAFGGQNPGIGRSAMNGHNQAILIHLKKQLPASLTLDSDTGRLYWVDIRSKTIFSLQKGYHSTIEVFNLGNSYRIPVEMDIFGDYIYWVTKGSKEILRLNKFKKDKIEVLVNDLSDGSRVKIIHDADQHRNFKMLRRMCKACSHLCIRIPHGYGCTCPYDWQEMFRRGELFCDINSEDHGKVKKDRFQSSFETPLKTVSKYRNHTTYPHLLDDLDTKYNSNENTHWQILGILVLIVVSLITSVCFTLSFFSYRNRNRIKEFPLSEVR